jgi:microsomal epoxide hydrolase
MLLFDYGGQWSSRRIQTDKSSLVLSFKKEHFSPNCIFLTRRAAIASLRTMRRIFLLGALLLALSGQARAADRFFVTSDGVRLHYIEQGQGRTLVLVPGWTMPAWIFSAQIQALSRFYRVVAFDPRSQGDSDVPAGGYEPFRRGRDIAELLAQVGDRAVLLGWSLGVLDVLSYIHQFGDSHIAGLVLVDNSVGEEPAPHARPAPPRRRTPRVASREAAMRAFVQSMFRVRQPAAYIESLTEATLHTPAYAARALLAYDVPRSYWKEAVYDTAKPVLYLVTPRLAGQAGNLAAHHPDAESVVLQGVGHAMFVDDPGRFDGLVLDFLRRRVWR